MGRTVQMNFRCDPEVKLGAEKAYSQWGLSLADAINVFMAKSIEVGGFPFAVRRDAYGPFEISFDDPGVEQPNRTS